MVVTGKCLGRPSVPFCAYAAPRGSRLPFMRHSLQLRACIIVNIPANSRTRALYTLSSRALCRSVAQFNRGRIKIEIEVRNNDFEAWSEGWKTGISVQFGTFIGRRDQPLTKSRRLRCHSVSLSLRHRVVNYADTNRD